MPAAAIQRHPVPAPAAPVVLVGPWANEAAPAPPVPAAHASARPAPPRVARPVTRRQWWANLVVGLSSRAAEAVLVLAFPYLFLWRHRRAVAVALIRVAAPLPVAYIAQGFLASSGVATAPPWATLQAAGLFVLLYLASAIGVCVASAIVLRAVRGTYRWLDDLARYGASVRPPD